MIEQCSPSWHRSSSGVCKVFDNILDHFWFLIWSAGNPAPSEIGLIINLKILNQNNVNLDICNGNFFINALTVKCVYIFSIPLLKFPSKFTRQSIRTLFHFKFIHTTFWQVF